MSKRLLSLMTVCFTLVVLWAIPAQAQFGAIEGDVKDVEGKPLVGAIIVLERKDIKGSYNTKTDKKGHYYHGGLPLGTFKIILKEGDKVLSYAD